MPIKAGQIVDFVWEDRIRLGVVAKEAEGRLQIVDEHGRTVRVSSEKALVIYDKVIALDEIWKLAGLRREIERKRQQIDVALLWEAVVTERQEASLADLARIYFGEGADAISCSALLRALFDDRIYFKQKGGRFLARSPEQVSAELARASREREHAEFRQRARAWLAEMIDKQDAEPQSVPEEMEPLVERIRAWLFERAEDELVRELLSAASGDPPWRVSQVAYDVLSKLGRIAEDADLQLLTRDLKEDFDQAVINAADALQALDVAPDPSRSNLTDLFAFTIDDEETREVDDALSLEDDGDNLVVGIHIADVSHFVKKGDPLDREAYSRGTTIYLPDRTVTMFPERLSCDLASLITSGPRPAISFIVVFDRQANPLDWRILRSVVQIKRRLTYDEVDRILASDLRDDLALSLRSINALAERLEAFRQEHGALGLDRPELKIKVGGEGIKVKIIDTGSPARRLVREMMILANCIAARFAYDKRIPVIFRTQDPPSAPPPKLPSTYDPLAIEKVLRMIKRSRLSLHPRPHAGLGLPMYVQLTSPIRRFTDLVIERQIAAHLDGARLPYDQDQLMEVMVTAEMAADEARELERRANHMWLAKYLTEEKSDKPLEAIIIERRDHGYAIELCDYFARGQLESTKSYAAGEKVWVTLSELGKKRKSLTFVEAP